MGKGFRGDGLAAEEPGDLVDPALFVQRVNEGPGSSFSNLLLHQEMHLTAGGDLGKVGDAQDLME